ncbi:hypothetical protein EB796_015162 [Bugula neritina]|uniref:Uncharacterized protein n=1 Tax=Bugula neritina TaxID=10212 RepID=A0A7J7JK88_BUGNE|nr:hypothetical protein EB796_015162 [Bugula neritina]
MESLTELHLVDCDLHTLPDSLSQLTHLHTLYVSRNKLGTLPEVIPKMESLTVLRLLGCDLHTLPDSLSQLTHLHTLYVSLIS